MFERIKSAKRSHKIIVGVVITILVILIVGAAVFYAKGISFLKTISHEEPEDDVYIMSVYVMNETGIGKLEEIKEGSYGVADGVDTDNMNLILKKLKSFFGPLDIKKYDSVNAAADALYKGDCKAMILNESFLPTLEETHPDFGEVAHKVWSLDVPKDYDFTKSDKDVTKESFNILLSGVDSRGDLSDKSLSDVNMIVTVNPLTNTILLTSIPRDSYVELASHKGKKDKLAHTGIMGIDETQKTIENLTGVKIDYYVKVNFAALVYVVDAMGGIDVESDREFVPWTNKSLVIRKGVNHMDGVMALAYARERYAYPDGDLHRAKNQRQVLRELAWKVMSPKIITSYDKLLEALSKGMETNMSDKDIIRLFKMQIAKMQEWDIQGAQISGRNSKAEEFYTMGKKKLDVVIVDQKSVDEAVDRIDKISEGVK